MEWVPSDREARFKLAPPLAFNCAVPKLAEPSRKVIVPAGTLLPDCCATAAVKVMLCDGNTWVEDAESVVVVATGALCSCYGHEYVPLTRQNYHPGRSRRKRPRSNVFRLPGR